MRKIGLFLGTFDPPHIGHLFIANYFFAFNSLDQIWFIPSPQNPSKTNIQLTDKQLRYQMLMIATKDAPFFKVMDTEFYLTSPNYSFITLKYFLEHYSDNEYYILMGSDNIQRFHLWRNHEFILNNARIIVYPRKDFLIRSKIMSEKIIVDEGAPLIELTSSWIRSSLKAKIDIRYALPFGVFQFIIEHNLYVSSLEMSVQSCSQFDSK
jgi:nicotinate-nucleotide adenylyltransferase